MKGTSSIVSEMVLNMVMRIKPSSNSPRPVSYTHLVPELISWKNSAVFDEIYHPRTAYEHIIGAEPYEVSHPPLGKLIMGLGIRMFGMTPFGYRFMGTLFGVLMLPILYHLLKQLFGRTRLCFAGTLLFAFDFMHFKMCIRDRKCSPVKITTSWPASTSKAPPSAGGSRKKGSSERISWSKPRG